MPRRRGTAEVQEKREELYRRLVRNAAEHVFAEHGFVRAKVEQIAAAAQVSIGTIYRVFPGRKEEIYRAIQEHHGTAVLGHTRSVGLAAWQRREDLLDAMLEGMAAMVDYFLAHPDYLRVVLREEKAWAVGPHRTFVEQTVMWHEGVEGTVMAMRKGIEDGVLVDDDPEVMARSLLALQQAHLGYWLEDGMREQPALVSARLQRQFMRAFCRPEVIAARGLPAASAEPQRDDCKPDVGTTPRRSG